MSKSDFKLLDTEDESVIAAGDDLEDIAAQLDLQIGRDVDAEEERGWFEWG